MTVYEATGKLPVIGLDNVLKEWKNDHRSSPGLFESCLAASSAFAQYCTVFFQSEQVDRNEWTNINDEHRPAQLGWLYIHELGKNATPSGAKLKQYKWKKEANFYKGGYPPHIGLCLPSSCSARDVGSAVAQLMDRRPIDSMEMLSPRAVIPVADENYCYTNEKLDERTAQLDSFDVVFT